MKSRVLAYALLLTLLQMNITAKAEEATVINNDANGQQQIVSSDIQTEVTKAKQSKKKNIPLR